MVKHSRTIIGLAAASLMFVAASANAQGKGKDKDKDKDKHKDHDKVKVEKVKVERVDNGVVVIRDRDRERNVVVTKVPPGLAKKPGQMPPGQYKKRYTTIQGATSLSELLAQRGYTIVRTTPYGTSRYVYYRGTDGLVHRAIVSPGTERLTFTNVPAALLTELLARLY